MTDAEGQPAVPRNNHDPAARRRRRVLAIVFMGTFMAPLDSSIVNIALPALTRHFGANISGVEWVVMAYLLSVSSLLLSAGRLGDMRGHKRVYVAGFVVFTVGSALCGLSETLSELIAARVLQGIGGALLLATGPAILTDAFPPERLGRALGTLSLSVSLGLTAGPFLGGIILANWGWRWIFFVNIPVGILVSSIAMAVLTEKRVPAGRRFDAAGSLAAFGALLAVLIALSMGNRWGWSSGSTLGLLAAAALLLALFISLEKRVADPMLDLALFGNRLFSSANASALINYVGIFSVTFLTPFYLLDVCGIDQRHAGLLLTFVPLATAAVAPLSGALSDRIGSRLLSSSGLAVLTLSLAGLSRMVPPLGTAPVALLLAAVGLGSGLFQPPNTSAIMQSVPRHRLGIASGMQATMRNVGMVLGVAMSGAIVTAAAPSGAADPSFARGISLAYMGGAAVTAAGVLTSLVRGPVKKP